MKKRSLWALKIGPAQGEKHTTLTGILPLRFTENLREDHPPDPNLTTSLFGLFAPILWFMAVTSFPSGGTWPCDQTPKSPGPQDSRGLPWPGTLGTWHAVHGRRSSVSCAITQRGLCKPLLVSSRPCSDSAVCSFTVIGCPWALSPESLTLRVVTGHQNQAKNAGQKSRPRTKESHSVDADAWIPEHQRPQPAPSQPLLTPAPHQTMEMPWLWFHPCPGRPMSCSENRPKVSTSWPHGLPSIAT